MKIISIIAKQNKLTINNLWVILSKQGLKISRQGFHKMAKSQGNSIKLPVLFAVMKFSGLTWAQVGEILER